MKIKVCGMLDAENIQQVKALGVDMIGLIFWPGSPRYVQNISSHAGLIPDLRNEDIAEGSDGGGSIRIPSAWCGCFGYARKFHSN